MKELRGSPTPLAAAARRVAALSAALLLIPWLAMQVTHEVAWGLGDFVVAGGLLFAAGMTYSVAARRLPGRLQRVAMAGVVFAGLAVVWAELAVGLFS